MDGWCPFARQHRGLAAGPFGYPAGESGQNRPLLFLDHRMGGWKRTLDDDVWRHENWVGVHGGIGRDGSLDQYTSILDASWGNGVAGSVGRFDRSNARLAFMETLGRWLAVPYAGVTGYALVDAAGVNVLNAHTISTEHEDEGIDQPWTPAQIATSIRWKRWCLQELATAGLAIETGPDMLAGHFQIDAINRPHCPGTNWPRAELLRALEGKEMKVAPWWTGRKLGPGKGTINLNVDFGPAKAYELVVVMDPGNTGQITFKHGDFKIAGVVGSRAANFVLVPGQFGTAVFEVFGEVKIAYLACAGMIS